MSHWAPQGMECALPYGANADGATETAKQNAGCLHISVNIILGIYYPINPDQKVTILKGSFAKKIPVSDTAYIFRIFFLFMLQDFIK